MKVEINYKRKSGKITNMQRLNNMLLKNYWDKKEIKGGVKNTQEQMKTKIGHTSIFGMQQKSCHEGSL